MIEVRTIVENFVTEGNTPSSLFRIDAQRLTGHTNLSMTRVIEYYDNEPEARERIAWIEKHGGAVNSFLRFKKIEFAS